VWSTDALWGTPFEQSCVEGDSVRWRVTVRGRGRGRVDRGSRQCGAQGESVQ